MHMKRTTIWLNADHTRQLAAIGQATDWPAPSAINSGCHRPVHIP